MNRLLAAIRQRSTRLILECIELIGGGQVDVEHRLVRAALIQVYQERRGAAMADRLMDRLGL